MYHISYETSWLIVEYYNALQFLYLPPLNHYMIINVNVDFVHLYLPFNVMLMGEDLRFPAQ